MAEPRDTARLDNFVDAAFAFAVTLLVVGGGDVPDNYPELADSLRDLPAFAVGFAIIAMFWSAHVSWRALCGNRRPGAMVLSLALVFLVLVYVYPLRLMAVSLVDFLGRDPDPAIPAADLGPLFHRYGAGFAAMSATIALLFAQGLRGLAGARRAEVRGWAIIYAILAATGIASTLVSRVPGWESYAPPIYALLPILIGLFAWRYDWAASRG